VLSIGFYRRPWDRGQPHASWSFSTELEESSDKVSHPNFGHLLDLNEPRRWPTLSIFGSFNDALVGGPVLDPKVQDF